VAASPLLNLAATGPGTERAAVTIRRMRLDDAAAVAGLTTELGYPVDATAQAQRIADLLEDTANHAPFVAVDAGDLPIGWAHVMRQRYLEGDATAAIMGMVVGEGHRSEGIGAGLLAACEDWARGIGCRRMTVRSRITRERAHGFYRQHGYDIEKTSLVFRKSLD
jgi:GNAT superfamily N-acetyltransferase